MVVTQETEITTSSVCEEERTPRDDLGFFFRCSDIETLPLLTEHGG
jgi:hypothetical protein